MTDASTTARTIDALCDAYVDDYCALDPLTATSIGVSGHEHQAVEAARTVPPRLLVDTSGRGARSLASRQG